MLFATTFEIFVAKKNAFVMIAVRKHFCKTLYLLFTQFLCESDFTYSIYSSEINEIRNLEKQSNDLSERFSIIKDHSVL